MSLELVTEPVLRKKTLGGASPSIQAGEPHSPLINMLNFISLLFLFFSFWEFPFFLPLLGQTSIQSTPEAASFLESKGSEGVCYSPLLCFLSFPFFSQASPLPFPSMEKPLVSLRSLSHFAKVSSPFLQRALCSFTESSRKSKEQEEETLPQEVDTGFFFFFVFFSHFPTLHFFLGSFPIFQLCLLLQLVTQVLGVLSS